MIAGGIILAGAFVSSHPDMIENPPESPREACDQLIDSSLCQAASTLQAMRDQRPLETVAIPPLPDSRRTPGAVDPGITQTSMAATICDPQYTARQMPPPSWKAAATRRFASVLHPGEKPENFALDQLVPLSLGGSPTDPRNLWLQPWTGETGTGTKDNLETLLNRMVCSGQITLVTAQQQIARNWIETYQRVMTPLNLSKYGLPVEWAAEQQPVQMPGQMMPEPMQIQPQNPQEPVVLQAEILPQGQSYEVPEIPTNDPNYQPKE